jgi:hypothetical protein
MTTSSSGVLLLNTCVYDEQTATHVQRRRHARAQSKVASRRLPFVIETSNVPPVLSVRSSEPDSVTRSALGADRLLPLPKHGGRNDDVSWLAG